MAAASKTNRGEHKVRCAHSNQALNIDLNHCQSCPNPSPYPAASHQHDVYIQQSQSEEHGGAPRHCHHFRCCHYQRPSADILPFFPRYETQWLCDEKLLIAWFEPDFSQARCNIDIANNGSNACTLIAILLSSYCSSEKVLTTCPHNQVSYCIIKALGIAMVNGNEIYNRMKREGRLPNVNLSIPEAISCAGKYAKRVKEWKSVLYMQSLCDTLYTNAQTHLEEWNASPHAHRHNYLHLVLISDSRSVLFIVNRKDESITLVDSHQHSAYKGAVIAVVNKDNFRWLCTWFAHVLCEYSQTNPGLYELSFLYYRQK